jgi:hypothetical protein
MKIFTLALFTIISFHSLAYAATVEVKWTEPDKYTDIREGNDNRAKFRENTFYNFEKHFTKLAENLPEGQVLKIEVTNIDLAGDTHAGGINRYRIIKEIYPPRMSFSYQLVNEDGSIAKEDTVELKDMGFMTGSRLKYRNEAIGYEKKMLDDWFFKDFKDLIVENK